MSITNSTQFLVKAYTYYNHGGMKKEVNKEDIGSEVFASGARKNMGVEPSSFLTK